MFCVRACTQTTTTAAPDYNTRSSSNSSFAPVVPSPGAAAGKPYTCCGQDVQRPLKGHTAVAVLTNSSTTLSGNTMSL